MLAWAAPRTKHIQMLIYKKKAVRHPRAEQFSFIFLCFYRLVFPLNWGMTNWDHTGELGAEWICLIRLLSSLAGKQVCVFLSVSLCELLFLCMPVCISVLLFLWVYASVCIFAYLHFSSITGL